MSKPCRRPTRVAIKKLRSEKKRQEKVLNAKLRATGQVPHSAAPLPNRSSAFATVDEEHREDAVSKQMRLLRKELPALLAQLEQIPDPRDPKKRRHKLTVLLLYGLLMFVFQFSSRRETNREISRPQFMTNLQLLFPEIDTLPHADTLFRLLRDIDLEQLEQAHVDLVKRLIRGKNFRRYLINHCYPIAIDGSQKVAGDTLWAEELLQRTVGKEETRHTQYFVYVLEASFAFHNGLVIPLLSEFLEHALGDTEAQKQDCELRGFVRLSERLKTCFPRLRILLLLDGLYSQNNVHERCNLGARQRWGIKAGFLVEKHQGHHYEHAFALDWNAMQGYHLLMRLAHVFNTLARFTRQLRDLYQELGVRGAIAFIRSSCAAPWLDPARIRVLLAEPFLLQLE